MMSLPQIDLCTFSKLEILYDLILKDCPLKLNKNKAKSCQCRKRLYHVPPADLRVLSCTFPNDWKGDPVNTSNPTKVEIDMSATSDPAAEKSAEKKSLFGETNGMPLNIPIIGLTGPKGSGKTLTGMTLDPGNTIVIDIEDSSVTYNLPIKKRYSMYEEVEASSGATPTPLECWVWFQNLIDSKDLNCRVLFVDPVTDMQQGLVEWVKSNPEKFGKTANQYKSASGLLWADVKSHLKITLGKLSRRVECFMFTAHMGSVWKGGAPVVGKSKAKGVDTFYELASLYLHLNRNIDPKTGKQPGAPTASISPPIGKSRIAHTTMLDTGEVKITPILPPTVTEFTWEKFREYVATPPNYNKLKKSELAQNQDLTDDEKLQLQAEIAANNREAEEMKVARIAAAQEAANANASARQQAASKPQLDNKPVSANQATPTESADPQDGSVKDVRTVKGLIAVIKDQFKQLKISKPQMVAAIEKRGGKGAKLADLSDEKLEELRKALWSKLTARDMQKK